MKKFINGIIALTICMSMVSCGSTEVDNDNSNTESIVQETEAVIPEYNTFGISVEGIVNNFNDSGKYTQTWSSDCIEQELSDGQKSFVTSNVIFGSFWSGTYEEATNNIIDITISYPCENDDESVNKFVACASASAVMEQLFKIDSETAMKKWMEAAENGGSAYSYNNYNIYVGRNNETSSIETIIEPKNKLK